MSINPALLVLEDGTVFRGRSFGKMGETFGEAVFTTGMTGYQEVFTNEHTKDIHQLQLPAWGYKVFVKKSN